MKKILLIVGLLAAVSGVEAQYVLTSAAAPVAGDINNVIIDTLPQVSKGNSGANQTWDFTNFDLDQDYSETYEDPSISSVSSSFPDADYITQGNFGFNFMDVTPTGINWIGVSVFNFGTGQEEAAPLDPIEKMYVYSSSFGSSFNSTSAWRHAYEYDTTIDNQGTPLDIDSLRFSYSSTKEVSYDGWGTITTPLKSFPEALRERTYQIATNTFEICIHNPTYPVGPRCVYQDISEFIGGGTDTSITYNWYNGASKFPVASITYGQDDETIQFAYINAGQPDGINTVVKNSTGIYPNPASSMVFIKASGVESVSVSDLQGRVVKSVNQPIGNSIDVSDLQVGHYVVSVITKDATTTQPLQILR